MNIYVNARGIRRLSENESKCNYRVFVLSQRDVPVSRSVSRLLPVSRMLRYAPAGMAGGFHVGRVIPIQYATADELRSNDRVLVPNNGDLGFLLTQVQMRDGEWLLTRFFEFEQVRAYGVRG